MNKSSRTSHHLRGSMLALSSFAWVTAGLLAPTPAHAALTLTYVRVQAGSSSQDRTIFDEHHIRMDGMPPTMGAGSHARQVPGRSLGGEAATHSVILDASLRKMVLLDPNRRTYREMTEADMKQLKASLDAMHAQMQARMKSMPPEQRKMMEQMMAGKGGAMAAGHAPAVRYEPLGKKKTVAGHPCEMYKVIIGDSVTSHTCFSPWGSGIVSKADMQTFKALATELRKMFDVLGMSGNQDWSKVPGVPVEETHFGFDGKTVEWTNTLKSVQRGPVPANTFAVPAGYTKEAKPRVPAFGGAGMGTPHGQHPIP